jgi:hypothetical protein
MNRKIALISALFLLVAAVGAFAADLTIDYQVNTTAKDYANNFLTFQGKPVSAVKDQFVAGPDGVSGASKAESTAMFNVYRWDIFAGKLLPGAFRSFLLYPVADDATRTGDNLTVIKNADGSITVRYIHRGTANEFTTDTKGVLTFPVTTARTRKIATTDNKVVSSDFSSDGTVKGVDWKKVWDATNTGGKQIGTTADKTGAITPDVATSNIYVWAGSLQFTFTNGILTVKGELNAANPKK